MKTELPSLPGSDVDMPSSAQVSKYKKTVYTEQDDFIVISDSDVEEMGGCAGENTVPDEQKRQVEKNYQSTKIIIEWYKIVPLHINSKITNHRQ